MGQRLCGRHHCRRSRLVDVVASPLTPDEDCWQSKEVSMEAHRAKVEAELQALRNKG
jgi:hypothetical protein